MRKSNLTFLILGLLLCISCKKIPKLPGTDPDIDTSTTGNYYLKGTFNGKPLNWQLSDIYGIGFIGSALSSTLDKGITIGGLAATLSPAQTLSPTMSIIPQIGIEFRTIRVSFDEDKFAYLKHFINVGALDYLTIDEYTVGTKSIVIYYVDKDEKEYTSIGPQTGKANITSVVALPPELGLEDRLRIKLTFSCKLYPKDGKGDALIFTNMEAIVKLSNYLY